MTQPITIAIDGLAATGKGTIARRLAADLNLDYLDTGLLYRVVGVAVLKDGGDPSDKAVATQKAQELNPQKLEELGAGLMVRGAEGAQAASKVAVIQSVRDALLEFQRSYVSAPPSGRGAVLDGRDIGTVIAPDAMVKIYVEASPEIRANRRFLELQGRGENVTEADVLKEMQERDARDASREVAPAKPAEDAIHLDTSTMNADEAYKAALAIVQEKMTEMISA